MTFLIIGLLILNILMGCLNHSEGNHKASAFNFFAAGFIFVCVLNAIL